MKTCSFLGHSRIYDRSLPETVKETLRQILAHENDLRFLFYDPYSDYTLLCLTAAMQLRQEYPHKDVETVLLGHNAELFLHNNRIPPGAIDHMVIPPAPPAGPGKYGVVSDKKYLRRMVLQTDYLVSYIYPGLLDNINREYRLALEHNIETFNLIREDTAGFMDECLTDLTETETYILHKLKKNAPLNEIAADCGFSRSAVVYYQHKFKRKISLQAQKRLKSLQ